MSNIGLIGGVWRESLFNVIDNNELATVTNLVNITEGDPVASNKTSIKVCATDTISAAIAAHKANPKGRIALLNFASFKNPGGGFMRNAMAQEEALCYCTNLYPNLVREQLWYDRHKTNLNMGAYACESILSQDITVLAESPGCLLPKDNWFTVDVLTCACPNWSSALRYHAGDVGLLEMLEKASFDRVQYVMHILSFFDYDTVILGAFGCGVFKNDPQFIAESFKIAIEEVLPDSFKEIVFAIPDVNSKNYRAFVKCFNPEVTKTSVF